MLVPESERSDILLFIQKYFVPDEMGAEPLTDEQVRVLYYESEGRELGDRVLKKYLHFDIYVRRNVLHTATYDRLQRRDKLIAKRLKELLTGTTYVCQMRYRFEDAFDLGAKTTGYKRYHITFSYKTTF